MTLPAEAPQWLVLVLVALLLAAAIEDAIRLRISNLTCLAVLVAGLAAMWLAGPEFALWQNFVVFAALLAIGTPLFAAGKLGGGDIKLLAVTGLWFPIQGAVLMLAFVMIGGGILALALIAVRTFSWSDRARETSKLLKRGGGIPYGVAISAGSIVAVALARGWG